MHSALRPDKVIELEENLHIRLSKTMYSRLTALELERLGRTQSNLRGLDNLDVSLLEMDSKEIEAFRAALVRLKDEGTRMLQPLIGDIDRWNAIMSGNQDAGEERAGDYEGVCRPVDRIPTDGAGASSVHAIR